LKYHGMNPRGFTVLCRPRDRQVRWKSPAGVAIEARHERSDNGRVSHDSQGNPHNRCRCSCRSFGATAARLYTNNAPEAARLIAPAGWSSCLMRPESCSMIRMRMRLPYGAVSKTALTLIAFTVAATPTRSALAQPTPPPQDRALLAYIDQVEREWPGESAQQELTADSLTLLADAVASMADRKQLTTPQVRLAIEQLRRQTQAYRAGTPGTLEQAKRLRRTFQETAALVDSLVDRAARKNEPVDPRLSALARAADSLDDDMLLRRQPDVIERFFHHAAAALRRVDAAR
jgi:hypothetical protein